MEFEDDETLSSVGIVGELGSMCSLSEAQLRSETRQVDKFELGNDYSKFVKKYQRSSADKKYVGADIRTEAACWNSVEYLLSVVLDFDLNPKPGYADSCTGVSYFDIYSFLRDRLRAVRVDLHVQNCTSSPVFIAVHEYCLRFELYSMFRLWGAGGVVEEKKFDLHLTLTALSQTIDPLTHAYANRRLLWEKDPGVDKLERTRLLKIEAEINKYILLLSLTSRGGTKQFKSHYLKQPREVQELVRDIFAVCCDYYSGRYVRLLNYFSTKADFLTKCAMLPVVNTARVAVLWRMVRTNRPFFWRQAESTAGSLPSARPEKLDRKKMMAQLGFVDVMIFCGFLNFHGIALLDEDHCLIPPRQLARHPVKWWFSSAEWSEKTGDAKNMHFEWPEMLRKNFSEKIGQEQSDHHPPERCLWGQHREGCLELLWRAILLKNQSSVKSVPKAVVAGECNGDVPRIDMVDLKVFSPPRPLSINSFPKPVDPVVVPTKRGRDSVAASSGADSVIPTESSDRLSNNGTPPLAKLRTEVASVIEKSSIFSAPEPVALPVSSWTFSQNVASDQLPSPTDATAVVSAEPSVPSSVTPIAEPIATKSFELPPIPDGMDLESSFDLLATALDKVQLSRPTAADRLDNRIRYFPEEDEFFSDYVTSHAKIMQAEIAEGQERMRELDIAGKRKKFVALKVLRLWRESSEESRRWNKLAVGSNSTIRRIC